MEGRDKLERWIIGAAVTGKSSIPAIVARLKDYDFARGSDRGAIYSAILRLINDNKDVDEVAMIEPCHGIGGDAWAELNACVSEYISNEYSGKLDDKIITLSNISDRDFLQKNLLAMSEQVRDGKLELQEAISKTNLLAETTAKRHNRTQDVAISEIVFDAIQAYRNREGKQTGLFGIPTLDKMMGTIRQGELIIVAARPAIGKSALAIYPCLRVARAGKGVALISTEMSVQQTTMRFLANMSGVYFAGVAGDEMISETQERLLGEQVAVLRQMHNLYIKEGSYTPLQIDAMMQRHADSGNPIGLLVIDYIQMLTPSTPSKSGNTVQDLTNITKQIKSIALKHKCVIVAMAQLNRYADPFVEPAMSQLKDCGELEQSADRIIGLYKDKDDPGITHVSLIKNRHGSLGKITLRFYGSTLRFADY